MQRLTIKLTTTLVLGLGLTLAWLELMSQLSSGVPVAHAAGPRYVAPAGTDGGNDCSDSSNPCATLQRAVDLAAAGDIIKVATGIYTGVNVRLGSHFTNGGLVTQVVYISKDVTIQGGYTAAFAEPPDPLANPTTLDAQEQGRAIYVTQANPTVEGLRLIGGNARLAGSPLIGLPYGGGGLLIFQGGPVLSGNTVTGNEAEFGGGLFIMTDGSPILSHNLITANTASLRGGGVGVYSSTAIALDNNQIHNNNAASGGGLYLNAVSTLDNNIIRGNTADFGGGLYMDYNLNATLTNNLIADNQANTAGSGLYVKCSFPRLRHTTLARNSGGDGSGVHVSTDFFCLPKPILLTNTILVSQTVGITVVAGHTATLDNTLWHDNVANWAGAGTIVDTNSYTGNPAFVNANTGNYHLTESSVAIDKGVDTGVTSDIDGDTRPQGRGYDLGADESPFLSKEQIWSNGGYSVFQNQNLTVHLDGHFNLAGPYDIYLENVTGTHKICSAVNTGPVHSGDFDCFISPSILPGFYDLYSTLTGDLNRVATAPQVVEVIFAQAPHLSISKSGPLTATASQPITYLLTITNQGNLTATGLVITDVIPAGAIYITGGTKLGQVVSWLAPSLGANGGVTQATFVVTATQSLTNDDYGVQAEGGYEAKGMAIVVTLISDSDPGLQRVFLPVILKP